MRWQSPFTIADARAQVLDHLDDVTGARYAPAGNYDKVDRALRVGLELALSDYVQHGGDRFDEEITVTTDATGVGDLSSIHVVKVVGVQAVPDSTGALFPIDAGRSEERGLPDQESRTLNVRIARGFAIAASPNPTDYLCGTVDDTPSGQPRGSAAFDELVVLQAAMLLGSKDDELRQALQAMFNRVRDTVVGEKRIPGGNPWPMRQVRLMFSRLVADLRWTWVPRDQKILLFFTGYYGGGF